LILLKTRKFKFKNESLGQKPKNESRKNDLLGQKHETWPKMSQDALKNPKMNQNILELAKFKFVWGQVRTERPRKCGRVR